MKRIIALLLVLLLLLVPLCACSPDENPDDGDLGGDGGTPSIPDLTPGSDQAADDLDWEAGLLP